MCSVVTCQLHNQPYSQAAHAIVLSHMGRTMHTTQPSNHNLRAWKLTRLTCHQPAPHVYPAGPPEEEVPAEDDEEPPVVPLKRIKTATEKGQGLLSSAQRGGELGCRRLCDIRAGKLTRLQEVCEVHYSSIPDTTDCAHKWLGRVYQTDHAFLTHLHLRQNVPVMLVFCTQLQTCRILLFGK